MSNSYDSLRDAKDRAARAEQAAKRPVEGTAKGIQRARADFRKDTRAATEALRKEIRKDSGRS